jgi:hypothetical protein
MAGPPDGIPMPSVFTTDKGTLEASRRRGNLKLQRRMHETGSRQTKTGARTISMHICSSFSGPFPLRLDGVCGFV